MFEAFIRNFFRLEQNTFQVASEGVAWIGHCVERWQASYLPGMRTEIVLRSRIRTIVIDAEFYGETFVSYWGGSEKVRSEHPYQLLTSMEYIRRDEPGSSGVEGILLYPCTGADQIRLDYKL